MMGDALVGVVTADEPKISLQVTTKDGCDGFTIGLALFFELCKTGSSSPDG